MCASGCGMRSPASLFLLAALPCALLCPGATLTFHVAGGRARRMARDSLVHRPAERGDSWRRRSDPGRRRTLRRMTGPSASSAARFSSSKAPRLWQRRSDSAPEPNTSPSRASRICARPSCASYGKKRWTCRSLKCPPAKSHDVCPRAMEESAPGGRIPPRLGRRPVGRRCARPARLRALPLPAAGAGRSRSDRSFPIRALVGVLRFRLPLPRRSGLLRAPLAQGRNRRAARGGLALLGARSPGRRVSAPSDRRLPSQRHPGLCLDRAAARERPLLGAASGVARKNRFAPGRPARLAQAHEPDQPRGIRRSRARPPRFSRPVRLGRRESGRAVFRVARRPPESGPFHPHEQRRARGIQGRVRNRPPGVVQPAIAPVLREKRAGHGQVSRFPRRSRPAASRPNGSPRWKTSARPNPGSIWR